MILTSHLLPCMSSSVGTGGLFCSRCGTLHVFHTCTWQAHTLAEERADIFYTFTPCTGHPSKICDNPRLRNSHWQYFLERFFKYQRRPRVSHLCPARTLTPAPAWSVQPPSPEYLQLIITCCQQVYGFPVLILRLLGCCQAASSLNQ